MKGGNTTITTDTNDVVGQTLETIDSGGGTRDAHELKGATKSALGFNYNESVSNYHKVSKPKSFRNYNITNSTSSGVTSKMECMYVNHNQESHSEY